MSMRSINDLSSHPLAAYVYEQTAGKVFNTSRGATEHYFCRVCERKDPGAREAFRQEVRQPTFSIAMSPCSSTISIQTMYGNDVNSGSLRKTAGFRFRRVLRGVQPKKSML